jgi:hypothetical protein
MLTKSQGGFEILAQEVWKSWPSQRQQSTTDVVKVSTALASLNLWLPAELTQDTAGVRTLTVYYPEIGIAIKLAVALNPIYTKSCWRNRAVGTSGLLPTA